MIRVASSRSQKIPAGALLIAINNHEIDDFLEYKFYNETTKMRKILIEHKGIKKEVIFESNEEAAITLKEPVYRQCENGCDFCFINGLPKGLRTELYFRDDDYRLSFLFGNFLSLTNINDDDIKKINRLRLSPLYVSVHTTDPELRKIIFKNDKASFIKQQLSSLIHNDIKIHCQIVVIPGITDGAQLVKTINDLTMLHPGVVSIGIVPVGKTKYINGIRLVSKNAAKRIIGLVESYHKQFKKKYSKGIVYCADEFYIKSGLPIPSTRYYDDFPQHENGIGMVRLFLEEVKSLRRASRLKGKFLFLTGKLASPYLNLLKLKLEELGSIADSNIKIIAISNRFLGNSITTSGLIGADDFARTINQYQKKYDRIFLPPNCTNDSGRFIDNKILEHDRVVISPKSVKELIKCLRS